MTRCKDSEGGLCPPRGLREAVPDHTALFGGAILLPACIYSELFSTSTSLCQVCPHSSAPFHLFQLEVLGFHPESSAAGVGPQPPATLPTGETPANTQPTTSPSSLNTARARTGMNKNTFIKNLMEGPSQLRAAVLFPIFIEKSSTLKPLAPWGKDDNINYKLWRAKQAVPSQSALGWDADGPREDTRLEQSPLAPSSRPRDSTRAALPTALSPRQSAGARRHSSPRATATRTD